LGNVPHPWALPIGHEVNIIVKVNICRGGGLGMGVFIFFSRRDIYEFKVPSKNIRKFLQVLSEHIGR